MNKQIEEMAKDLGGTWVVDLEGNPHDLNEVLMQCDIENISTQLCEMGYRKQIVGEWEQFGLRNPKCSLCRSYNIEKSRFCPNCGARMKGDEGK